MVVIEWIDELRRLQFRDNDALFPPDEGFSVPLARPNRVSVQPWITADGVRRAFRRGCEAASIPYINPHAVRHALAALGREVHRTVEEELAWSYNLGHEDVKITRSHYAKMTDARRDSLFDTMRRRDPASEEDKDLLIRYHEHELSPGTPEFLRAPRERHSVTCAQRRHRNFSARMRLGGRIVLFVAYSVRHRLARWDCCAVILSWDAILRLPNTRASGRKSFI